MDHRTEREKKLLADFPKGSVVRVRNGEVDCYIASIANKLRDRIGEVTGHQVPTPNPIVTFFAIGRRKEYRQVFHSGRDIECVTDEAAIAAWRAEVDAKRLKAEAALAKTRKLLAVK